MTQTPDLPFLSDLPFSDWMGEVQRRMETALTRLLPAEEAWARDTAQTPAGLASLSALLKVRQPIAALSGTQTQGKPPAQGDLNLRRARATRPAMC